MSDNLTHHDSCCQSSRTECTPNEVTFTPRFDVWESDDELVLYGDMPGVSSEDLDIRFENRELAIHGKVVSRHQEATFLSREYGVGGFYRTFTVGESVDADGISAELQQGLLTIRLPKTEEVKPRRIKVQAGS